MTADQIAQQLGCAPEDITQTITDLIDALEEEVARRQRAQEEAQALRRQLSTMSVSLGLAMDQVASLDDDLRLAAQMIKDLARTTPAKTSTKRPKTRVRL